MSAVIVMSPEELAALVRDAVRDALEERAEARPPQWLTAKEAAEHLGVSRRTITNLVQKHALTPSKVGNQLRFRRADLDAYLAGPVG